MKFNLPKNKLRVPKFRFDKHFPIIVILLLIIGTSFFFFSTRITSLQNLISSLTQEKDKNLGELEKIKTDLETLKNQDQLKRNDELQEEIANIHKTYNKAVSTYESLLDLKAKTSSTKELDTLFAQALSQLSKKDFTTADSSLNTLVVKINEEDKKLAASFTIPQNVPESNTAPGSGYSRQSVNVEGLGSYMVSLVAGDLGSTRVIVDTAADSDCTNDCPTLPLASYVSRNGAFAGVNGTYFCPADYPSCAGKTNT